MEGKSEQLKTHDILIQKCLLLINLTFQRFLNIRMLPIKILLRKTFTHNCETALIPDFVKVKCRRRLLQGVFKNVKSSQSRDGSLSNVTGNTKPSNTGVL